MTGKRISFHLVLFFWTASICFLTGEALIRAFGSSDGDGNFTFRSRRLRPYYLPVRDARAKIHLYRSSSSTSSVYDPHLGWAPKPHGTSKDGFISYNSQGIRSFLEYSLMPQKGRVRIALFGDSLTQGVYVPFESTWGHYLEKSLKANDINAEVLNFGVGGYGIDQAFLRWKYLGNKFSPDIVILGFFQDDVKRNVNLMRAIKFSKTDIPFLKPRFILDGGQLRLINSPTPSPEKVLEIMERIGEWDLAKYEYFYDPKDYQRSIWTRSKFMAFALEGFTWTGSPSRESRPNPYYYHPDPQREPIELASMIISQFKRDVEAKGGHFLVVDLPSHKILAARLRGRRSAPLEQWKVVIPEVIPTQHPMIEEARISSLDSLFVGGSLKTHYSAKGNKVVANEITQFLLDKEKLFLRQRAKR